MPVAAIINHQQSSDERIYRSCAYAVQEIQIAERTLADQRATLEIAITNLAAAFAARDMARIKQCADVAAAAAGTVDRTAMQIRALSQSLGDTFGIHLQRRGNV